jgi:hypothetical protein
MHTIGRPPHPEGCWQNGGMAEHYQRPGWFTTNVFNRLVAGLTRLGVSVYGSRVLEVGPEVRSMATNPGEPPPRRRR